MPALLDGPAADRPGAVAGMILQARGATATLVAARLLVALAGDGRLGGKLRFGVTSGDDTGTNESRTMIRLSKHTSDFMGARRITFAYIEAALTAPDWTTPDPTDPNLSRSFKAIAAFGNRILRVVHRPDSSDIFVVTAHWDRGAKQ